MQILIPALIVLATSASLVLAMSRETSAPPPPCAPQDAFHPGPQHARLQQSIGTWDAVVIANGPQGEQRTHGTLKTEKHTGFHTLDTFEGEFMGAPFNGRGINGYCTVKQQYFTFWTDSMTSSPLLLYGDYDAQKRELVLKGECFAMSGKLEPCRAVARYQDDDHYTWALYGNGPDGKELQMLRIEYTRKR